MKNKTNKTFIWMVKIKRMFKKVQINNETIECFKISRQGILAITLNGLKFPFLSLKWAENIRYYLVNVHTWYDGFQGSLQALPDNENLKIFICRVNQ